MPLKSSSERERESEKFSFNRSAFYTVVPHNKVHTQRLVLKVFLSPPQTTKKKERRGTS